MALAVGCLIVVGACAKGTSSIDDPIDDGGPATTAGPGGAGGTGSVGPTGPGTGGAGNSPGPGVGGAGPSTGGSTSTGGTTSTGGMGQGGMASGSGGQGGVGQGGMGGTPVTCNQILLDVSFDAGSPNPSWTESSTNFGSPLCTIADCGQGGGTGPRTGTWWFWGGGVAAPDILTVVQEIAYVEQTVTIPAGTATLEYYLQMPSCDTTTSPDLRDFFIVGVDGTSVYTTDSSIESAAGNCNAAYNVRSVNLDAYADGGQHTITFYVDQLHDGLFSTAVSNFFVDDVALTACN